jgi:transcriptional accessory protein Tex/SPT6
MVFSLGVAKNISQDLVICGFGSRDYLGEARVKRGCDFVKEFPDLDVSICGAVSIGHRLQDPLAELVKIDPKAIGVGQYQHDVSQFQLARKLDAIIEDCVNAVGVEINTASAPLLSKVSGLSDVIGDS